MSEPTDSRKPHGEIVMAKRAMRARMRETLRALTPTRYTQGGAAIARRVLESDEVRRARVVVGFVPMRRGGTLIEAEITPLLDGVIGAGCRVALPRCTGDGGLVACEVGEDWRGELVATAIDGVLEPGPGARAVELGDIDVVIVPGLAFDGSGGRLGRGKGFYDRFLGALRRSPSSGPDPRRRAAPPFLIGVCLEEQLVARVDREGHDAMMDCVVTDVRTMRMAPSRD